MSYLSIFDQYNDSTVINTIEIKDGHFEGVEGLDEKADSFDIAYAIRKGYYYQVEGDAPEGEEMKAHVMRLRDYNGDGKSLEFALFDAAYCMGLLTTFRGAFQTTYGGKGDGFVTKLAASGNGILYSSYLGGNGDDSGAQIAVSARGRAYIVGGTESSDFPTARPVQASLRGTKDGFLLEFGPSGASLMFSTFLGGGKRELFEDVALDAKGAVILSGLTSSDDFPVVRGMQSAFGGGMYDIVIAKFARANRAATSGFQLGQRPQTF